MLKKIIIIIIGLLLIGIFFYFFLIRDKTISTNQPTTETPTRDAKELPFGVNSDTKKDGVAFRVKNDFVRQYNNQDMVLGKTVVLSPYALQEWYDKNVSGTTLLKLSADGGWLIVGGEGGVINEEVLIYFGVPSSYSKKLIDELKGN